LKLDAAGYVQIQKKFKGKLPLTPCRLTAKGERALESYSKQMLLILSKTAPR
jgi:hypothetical protein